MGGDAAAAQAPTDPPADLPADPPAEPEKKKSKKQVKRIPLNVNSKPVGMSNTELMEAQEGEGKMQILDRIIRETADAMNALESRVYSMRDDMSTRYASYATEAEKEKISKMLTETEDWLYDDGFDAEKSVYEAKLKDLTVMCDPIVLREHEATDRPEAIGALAKAIERFEAFVVSTDEAYAHIEQEEKAKVGTATGDAKAWLAEMERKLDGLDKTADPPFKAAELTARLKTLEGTCDPIMSKPKPIPKPDPTPPPAEPAKEATDAPPPDEGAAAEPPPAEPSPTKPDNMDVD